MKSEQMNYKCFTLILSQLFTTFKLSSILLKNGQRSVSQNLG
jgi:hypothetical protein